MPITCEKTENDASTGVHLSKLPKNGQLATIHETIRKFGRFKNLTWQYEPTEGRRNKELVIIVYYNTRQEAASAQKELDNLPCGDNVLKAALLVPDEQINLILAEGDSLPEAGQSNKEQRLISANESEQTEQTILSENGTSDVWTGSKEFGVSRQSKSFRKRQKRKLEDSHSSSFDDTQSPWNRRNENQYTWSRGNSPTWSFDHLTDFLPGGLSSGFLPPCYTTRPISSSYFVKTDQVWLYRDQSEMEQEYPYRAAEIANCNSSDVSRLHKPIGEECWQVHIENIGLNTTWEEVQDCFKRYGNIYLTVINEPGRDSPSKSADIYFRNLYEAANVAKLSNGYEFNNNILSVGIVLPPNQCRATPVNKRDMSAVSEINASEVVYGDVGEHDWPVQVSNFMVETSHDDIKKLFNHFGEITRIRMYSPSFKINGFDYVKAEIFFKTQEQAAQSFIMDNVMYNCRLIVVCMPDNLVQVSNWRSDLPIHSLVKALSPAGLVKTVMPIVKIDKSIDVLLVVFDSSQAASRAEAQFHKLNVLGTDLKIKQLYVVSNCRNLAWLPKC